MSIILSWHDDAKTMLRYDFPESWTWQDFYQAFRTGTSEYTATVDHPVDILIHLPEGGKLPASGHAISNARRALKEKSPNLNRIVVVGGNALVKAMVNVLSRVYQRQFLQADTLAQAEAMLAAERVR